LQPTDTTTGGSAGNEDRTEVSENKVYTKSLTPPITERYRNAQTPAMRFSR
jgi:hypothetical protein